MRSVQFGQTKFAGPSVGNYSRLTSGSHLSNLNQGLIQRGASSKRSISPKPKHNIQYEEDNFNLDAILNSGEVFPQDLLLLLTEQSRNIKSFKSRIEKEKFKVVNDMQLFKKQINHIIDDLKISMLAELDVSYKTYIEKYAYLKSQVQQIRLLKKQIQAQNVKPDVTRLNSNSSNSDMVKEIEREVANLRSYKISQYINDIQKKKLFPLMELSKDLIIMTSSPFQFYDAATTSAQLAELRANFSHFTKHMFNALKTFVRTPDGLLQLGKQQFGNYQQDNNIAVQQDSQQINNIYQNQLIPHARNKTNIYKDQSQAKSISKINKKKIKTYQISQSLQSLTVNYTESVTLSNSILLKPSSIDSLLCAISVGNVIVSGGRNGLLSVLSLNGNTIRTLKGHQASICSLALIQDRQRILLASGSDHGCSSIIIWDTQNWNIISKMQNHSAAVTSIVDMGDGQTIISGSYDKKINIYNYKTSTLVQSIKQNKSSVFSIVLNSSKTKLVAGVLDNGKNGMYIYNVNYGVNAVVSGLTMQRFIQNNNVICSMIASNQNPYLIVTGTKDGKIKLWNISSGQCSQTLNVNRVSIIQLLLIERQSNLDKPLIISGGVRDATLTLTNSETGNSNPLDTDQNIYLEYGCGIGPKVIFGQDRKPTLIVVNQNKQSPEIAVFDLNL